MRDERLANGMRVLVAPLRTAPVVSTQLWMRVGSADERPDEAGLAHLFEHMVFKGTEQRGVGEVARQIEAAGGDINAYTSFDHTVVHCTVGSHHLDLALDVLADAVFRAALDAEEVRKEIEVVIEELLRGNDNHGRVATEMLFSRVFEYNPYGRPVIGSRATIESFDRSALVAFLERWYQPSNACLVVAGDIDPDRTLNSVIASFGGLPSAKVQHPIRRPEPEQTSPRVQLERRAIQSNHLLLGWKGPSLEHPDTPLVDLWSVILGAGESSRLYRQLKREQELVTDAYAFSHTPTDAGLLGTGVEVQQSDLVEVFGKLVDESFRMVSKAPSARELEKAKTIILSEQVYQQETVDGWARKLGYYATTVGNPDFEKVYYDAIRRATPDQIRRVAQSYVQVPRTSAVALLAEEAAPDLDEDRLAEILENQGRSRTVRRPSIHRNGRGLVHTVLTNGLRVIVQEDHTLPRVAMRSASVGGLLAETDDHAGVSCLASQVLVRGTGSYSAEQIIENCDATAAGMGGVSGRSSIGVAADVLLEHFDTGLDMFLSCLLEPRFEAEEVEREKRSQLEDIVARADSPSAVAFDLFSSRVHPQHPYARPIVGTQDSVPGLAADTVKSAYWAQMDPERTVLAVVGAVEADALVPRLEDSLGGYQSPVSAFPLPRCPKSPEAFIRETRTMKREQAHVIVGFAGLRLHDPRRYAVDVLTTVLGGQSGRLFMELRDRRSLAYSVTAVHLDGWAGGALATYAACQADKADEVEQALKAELSRLPGALDHSDVDRARTYLAGSHAIGLQRATARASALALMEAYGLGFDEPLDYPQRVAEVTLHDVRELAAELVAQPGWISVQVLPAA